MKNYELVLIINPEPGEDKVKGTVKAVEELVTSLKGKVAKTTDWGKRELSYPIKKLDQGSYFLLAVSLPESAPQELDKKLKLMEEIIRYLITSPKK